MSGGPVLLKAFRKKDYSENPQTLEEHLKKRRKELDLLQREAAKRMGTCTETYANWEKGKTEPGASEFRLLMTFLGFDPSPVPTALAERFETRRRELGVTLSQVARHLGWDEGTLTRYLNGTWRMPPARAVAMETRVPQWDIARQIAILRDRLTALDRERLEIAERLGHIEANQNG